MRFLRNFADKLREPTKKITLTNQDARLALDLEVLRRKPEFYKVISDIQQFMVNQSSKTNHPEHLNLELGAGVIPLSGKYSHVKSTDVIEASHLDGVLDATNLDLPDNSVQNLFLQNTFHHIPDPQAFFDESLRVLKNGGRVVILDPYYNRWSSLLYPVLFKTESFNKLGCWNDASNHAMIGANQALTYIVFKRDVDQFKARNPYLNIVKTQPLNFGLRYLLTGGLNFRQLVPKHIFEMVRIGERVRLIPKSLSIHWVIVLEKSREFEDS